MKSKENLTTAAEPVSKSQRRREALELKNLAGELIRLAPSARARVPLDDELLSAIEAAGQIRSNVAGKRQLQYVAKLLRRIDTEPVYRALEAIGNEARGLTARQHRVEAWRDHLLESGDRALGDLLAQRRDADGQAIRQLVRNAGAEKARGKPPAAARALFRLLRDLDETVPLPTPVNS